LGTPLVAYPFGNLKNVATFTAYPFRRLVMAVRTLLRNDGTYEVALKETMRKRELFLKEFDSISLWDDFYTQLGESEE